MAESSIQTWQARLIGGAGIYIWRQNDCFGGVARLGFL